MSDWTAKRFWKEATVGEVSGGYGVLLDGRPVRTPAKAPLIVPTREMAAAIAAEWDAQEGKIDPLSMPVTRGANAAIDKVSAQHAEVVTMLADYGDADLICYRATFPEELIARQAAAWDPLILWAKTDLGAALVPIQGVIHRPQDPDALRCLHDQVAKLDAFALAAFHDLVSLSGSLIIGFAVLHNSKTAEELWSLSRIDEAWQQEQWGEDDEALETAAIKKSAFLQAKVFLTLLGIT